MSVTDSPKTSYLRSNLLSKFVSKDTDSPLVRRTRAINKWLATERNNEATNVRLLTTHDGFQILPHVKYETFMEKAREIVTSVIGESFPVDSLLGGFSGGASTSRGRTSSHPAGKYLGQADVTEAALPYWELLLEESPTWKTYFDSSELELRVVPGNILFTVPKSTDIDRCACKEPDINMYMQRGLGRVIRNRLRRVGIDLNDQSRNRELAREGSISGELATLDLSSASDSISTELVFQLLPIVWFSALNSLRSPVTVIDKDVHVNEMFSSMGNGFTFELESLLFYAIARTVAYFRGVSGVISVYGDDIIAPTSIAQDIAWVLNYLGFEVNTKKSFWSGPFRESCGGHFINGPPANSSE